MSFLKAVGIGGRIRRAFFFGALCVLLGLFSVARLERAEASGAHPKAVSTKCAHLTGAAVFRDGVTDGIRSDSLQIYSPLYEDYYGSTSEYHGWEDSTVCLMEYGDYDFIMGTAGTKFETTGIDRTVVLDFMAADPFAVVPFAPIQVCEVTIRSDYVYSDTPYEVAPKRLILWFSVGRTDFNLYFDEGDDDTDMVWVTQTGTAAGGNRVWTIESTGYGRLYGGRKLGVVGHYLMPFKITIYESGKPNTCF
ncbi:MAG: hypothetical protein MUO52_08770 [Desulfobacterales bacterium]|nr:hypothetical protein [Desulfobacterales bacterium]